VLRRRMTGAAARSPVGPGRGLYDIATPDMLWDATFGTFATALRQMASACSGERSSRAGHSESARAVEAAIVADGRSSLRVRVTMAP
jgi:hypothetical protein